MYKLLFIPFLFTSYLLAKQPKNYYVHIERGVALTEKGDLGLKEPMENIVGGDAIRTEVEVGWFVKEIKTNKQNSTRIFVFLYGWEYDKAKWDEMGFGIGTKIQTRELNNIPIRFQLKVATGFGWQDNNGEKFVADTNSNLITYTTNTIKSGAYPAIFYKDTTVIEMNLGLALVYDINKNISLTGGYTYLHKYYNYGYILDNYPGSANISGSVQSGHYFNVGFDYRF